MSRSPAQPHPPRLDPVDPGRFPLEDAGDAELISGASLTGRRISGLDLAERDLSGLTLDECLLTDVELGGAQLRGHTLRESRLDRISAPAFRGARAHWRDVELHGSRLGSVELYDSAWEGVLLADSKLGFLNLRGSKLRDVRLENCQIEELDLSDCAATRLDLSGCRVDRLDVTGATLSHADLRGLEVRQIDGLRGLAGATVSGEQAAMLAELFAREIGITVLG